MLILKQKWLIALLISFVLTAIAEPILIPILRRLKFGQSILEDGPTWHGKKQGTPTMGGMAFILGTVAASFFVIRDEKAAAMLICGVLFGVIGFTDDYIKVIKKHNKGFSAGQKFLCQTIVSVGYALYLYFRFGQTETLIPFAAKTLDLGVFYIPFVALVLLATSNSANLTDGLDGLASSVGAVIAAFFTVACMVAEGTGEGSIISAALCGGLLGFLIYNKYPAKVFMGDTGSLFLGGTVAAIAIGAKMEIILIISAFVFLVEALSVIIQVSVYKKTRKRVFKMAPVHHHFEMCGWKETKIVFIFSLITAVFCAVAYLALK